MSNEIRWSSPTDVATVMSSELDSLADNARALGSATNNSDPLHQYADFELNAAFSGEPDANGLVALYLIPALDNTNFSDGSSSTRPQPGLWVGNFQVRPVTTGQRLHLRNVVLPPFKFKPLLENRTGQAFPASGSSLRARFYNDQIQ